MEVISHTENLSCEFSIVFLISLNVAVYCIVCTHQKTRLFSGEDSREKQFEIKIHRQKNKKMTNQILKKQSIFLSFNLHIALRNFYFLELVYL